MATCTALKEVEEILGKNLANVDSASLRLRKLVHLGDNSKGDEIKEVCKRINNRIEQRRWFSSWTLPDSVGKSVLLRLQGRLVIHLTGGILENAGMCIHPHFNCPFILGSGVKGVARHAAWAKWNESKSLDDALKVAWTFGFPTGDKKGLDVFLSEQKTEWFGKNGKYSTFAGLITFLPAFPVAGDFEAVTDITTCHHMDYYNGKKDRATDDEEKINPQPFPAIEAGSLFRFVLRPLSRIVGEGVPAMDDVLKWAEQFLIEGMTLFGAGAKTAAGYGWFSVDQEAAEAQKAEAEERAKKEAEEKRMKSLSPVDLAKETLLKHPDFGTAVNQILDSGTADQKLALIAVLQNEKSEDWKDLKKRAKKQDKAKVRVDKLLAIAKETGKELS
jgi:CRISPR type III-B/RAMP module RAMP protein Cmr6